MSTVSSQMEGTSSSPSCRRKVFVDQPLALVWLRSYKGTTDMQLERINVYFNEAAGTSFLLTGKPTNVPNSD